MMISDSGLHFWATLYTGKTTHQDRDCGLLLSDAKNGIYVISVDIR